jgi:hypothetical protein
LLLLSISPLAFWFFEFQATKQFILARCAPARHMPLRFLQIMHNIASPIDFRFRK